MKIVVWWLGMYVKRNYLLNTLKTILSKPLWISKYFKITHLNRVLFYRARWNITRVKIHKSTFLFVVDEYKTKKKKYDDIILTSAQ